MRRFFALGVFLLAASFAFAVPVSTGLLVAWAPLEGDYQTVTIGQTVNVNYTFETLGVRAFVDLTYVEASVGFRAAVTQLNTSVTVLGVTGSTNQDFSDDLLDIRLIGKYPFNLGSFTLFPLAGLVKDFCLSGSVAGIAFSSDSISDSSPWYLEAGVGADVNVAQKLYLRAELSGAYNITSKRSASFYTGSTYQSSSGWQIQFAAGIGYSLD